MGEVKRSEASEVSGIGIVHCDFIGIAVTSSKSWALERYMND